MQSFYIFYFSLFYVAKLTPDTLLTNRLSSTFEIKFNYQNTVLVERLFTQSDLNAFERAITKNCTAINNMKSWWSEATPTTIPNILMQMNTKLYHNFSKILPNPFVTYVYTESYFIYWDKDKKETLAIANFYPNYVLEGVEDNVRYKEYTTLSETDDVPLNARKIVHDKQDEFHTSYHLKFAKKISFLSINKVMKYIKIYEEPCLVLLDQSVELVKIEKYEDGSVGLYKSYMFDLRVINEMDEGKYNMLTNLGQGSILLGQFKQFCGSYQPVIYDGYKLEKYHSIVSSNHNCISCIPVMLWILETNDLRIYSLSDEITKDIEAITKQIMLVYACNFAATSDKNPILQSNLQIFRNILEKFCFDLQDDQESMEDKATLTKIRLSMRKDLQRSAEDYKKTNNDKYLHFHDFIRKMIKNNAKNQKITDYLINFFTSQIAESYKNYQHFSDDHKKQLIEEINCTNLPTLKCYKRVNMPKKILPESYAAKDNKEVDSEKISEVESKPGSFRCSGLSPTKSFDILDDLALRCLFVSALVKNKEKNEKLFMDCFPKFLEILFKICKHEPDPNDKEPWIYKANFLLLLSKISILHSIMESGKARSGVEKCYSCGVAKFERSYGLKKHKGFFDNVLSKNMSNDERLIQYQSLEDYLKKRFGNYLAKHLILYYDFRGEWRRPQFKAENNHIMGNIRAVVSR